MNTTLGKRVLPLTHAQRFQFMLESIGEPAVAHRVTATCNTDLDRGRLQAAVELVARRHPMCGVVFTEQEGRNVQTPGKRLPVVETKSSETSSAFRVVLEENRRLVLFAKPQAMDRASLEQVLVEMVDAYEQVSTDEAPADPFPALVPATELSTDAFNEQLGFWIEQLTPMPDPLKFALPTPGKPASGLTERLQLPDVSYATLASAWAALLHRYTGSGDFILVIQDDHRSPGEPHAVAPLTSFYLQRVNPKPAKSFRLFEQAMVENLEQARRHNAVGSDQLLLMLEAEYDPCSVALTRRTFPQKHGSWNLFDEMPRPQIGSQLELIVSSDGAGAFIAYDGSSFSAETAAELAEDLCLLLNAALDNPTLALAAIDLPDRLVHQRYQTKVSQQAAKGSSQTQPMQRVSRDQPLPLSFSQQRLWFLDQLQSDSAHYNVPIAVDVEGQLLVNLLEQGIRHIVQRHEILRTTYEDRGGDPFQVIQPTSDLWATYIDISSLENPELTLKDLTRREALTPFNLAQGPILRLAVIDCGKAQYRILLTLHHIASDAWSSGVLIAELSHIYRALLEAKTPTLPDNPIQYADYAAWQRDWSQTPEATRQLDYWRSQLAGVPPSLDFPFDHPRSEEPTTSGALVSFRLDSATTNALKAYSAKAETTLYSTLLSALSLLLHRYTHQWDVAVGSPFAGRNRHEVHNLIGFFVNTLVMRISSRAHWTFPQMLAATNRVVGEGFAHQDAPYEQVLDTILTDRGGTREASLFDVMFVLQNAARTETMQLPGMDMRIRDKEFTAATFDISLFMEESSEGLTGLFEYRPELLERDTMQRFADCFTHVIGQILEHEQVPLNQIAITSVQERARELEAWNHTTVDFPHQSLVDFLAQPFRNNSDQLAVTGPEAHDSLTYAELEQWISCLRHRLYQHGLRPGEPVGIMLDRGPALVAAMRAVIDAGGCYVPLDPLYPQERLGQIATQADLRLIFTDRQVPPQWENVTALSTEQEDQSAPPRRVGLSSPAYVFFTSGSTGKPKGVPVSRQASLNFLSWSAEIFGDELKLILSGTSINFDLSVFELFAPGGVGGTVILGQDPILALDAPLADQATLVNTVPSAVSAWLESGRFPKNVRTVNFGGEALPLQLVKQLYELPQVERVFNLYGPTEATTYISFELVPREETREPSIGLPLANSRLYLLDQRAIPVPLGVRGQIAIAGKNLAMGYLNRPKESATAFIPDMGGGDGERCYLTGDLGRRLPDGRLIFEGRIDHQVKLRGYRIEPGEIQHRLNQHPKVAQSLVVISETAQGPQLVAYVRSDADTAPTQKELIDQNLAPYLPAYMIPSAWVFLESFPLTPNGKINRAALPAPQVDAPISSKRPPSNETERTLFQIWSSVLGHDGFGMDDDFFSLGGHSLLATRVISRIRESHGVSLGLRALFDTPTIAGLAESVARASHDHLPEIKRLHLTEAPLSPAQRRLWFLDQWREGGRAYHLFAGRRLHGALVLSAVERAVTALTARHEILRTTLVNRDGEPLQLIAPPVPFELPVLDCSSLTEVQVRQIIEAIRTQPFDLTQGPLFRVFALREQDDRHLVFFTMHHTVADGGSMELFLRELETAYQPHLDVPTPADPLALQYADYAQWCQDFAKTETHGQQLNYWLDALADLPPSLDLPTDRPRPAERGNDGAEYRFSVPTELVARLETAATEANVTLFMFLLSAFQVLLARYANQRDIAVGTPVNSRKHLDLETVIGFFVNTLVLRSDLSDDPSAAQLLKQVRAATLESFTHGDVPFEELVERLQPQRDPSRTPLFQVAFALQDLPTRDLSLPGLDVEQLSFSGGTAKFDLTLVFLRAGSEITGSIEYSTDLFEAPTITRMGKHLLTLLDSFIQEPDQPVSHLTLTSPSERNHLLQISTGTSVEPLQGVGLHHLVDACARQNPHAPALIGPDGETLSYQQFQARIEEVAAGLRARGIGPESLVGVSMQRSPERVLALHGILRTGAAYVPVDPDFPQERFNYVLDDAQLDLLVVDTVREITASAVTQVAIVDLPAASSQAPLDGPFDSGHLAYVIYTSGSTGKPKGAGNSHRAICNRLLWMQDAFPLTETDRIIQKTPYTFDVSVWEFFWPLMTGAALVVAAPGDHREPQRLLSALRRHRISVMHFVPAMLDVFLEETEDDAPSLRRIFSSGEALMRPLWQRFQERFPKVQLVNLYGPTEAAVDVTSWVCRTEDTRHAVPIGEPISGLSVHILDDHLEPVPTGVPGRLFLGGLGLARGYHRRPALTAEKFIPHPFAEGQRIYDTGDLGRRPANDTGNAGPIEFLGRVDHQIKLRGLRIELGEIDAQLGADPAVAACRTLPLKNDSGANEGLIAYVVPDTQQAPLVRRWSEMNQEPQPAHLTLGELDNGLPAVWLNKGETEFVFQEIFEHQVYLNHGIRLDAGATVMDVGANIGLFSLFAHYHQNDIKLHSFEPLPPIFAALERNCLLHGLDVTLHPKGLAETEMTAEFTFYPHNSIVSGRFAGESERETVRNLLMESDTTGVDVDGLLEERLRGQNFECHLTTLSQVIRDYDIQRIDLLKVDVEKSERQVLQGIEAEHWPLIQQLVVEVDDHDGGLEVITTLLRDHGFQLQVDREKSLATGSLYNVYAQRSTVAETAPAPAAPVVLTPREMQDRLVQHARANMPAYMCPDLIQFIPAMPLNRSGKVDLKALPAPNRSQAHNQAPPTTPTERAIAEIWQELLGGEATDVNADFFAAGGHSLSAARFVARLHRQLELEIGLPEFFENPTIRALAHKADTASTKSAGNFEDAGEGALSFSQQRLWFLEQLEGTNPAYYLSTQLRIRGILDLNRLEQATEAIVARHHSLRTVFTTVDDQPRAHLLDAQAHLTQIDLEDLDPAHAEHMVQAHAAYPFSLERGPLWRLTLLRLAPDDHILLVNMHHIISDGWSLGIMVRELAGFYNEGAGFAAPELPIQYSDYARRRVADENLAEQQLAFWREHLQDAPPRHELPTDRPRPAVQSFEGATHDIHLDAQLSAQLSRLAQDQRTTLFSALEAALVSLLSRYAGQDDWVIGSPVANRDTVETEPLIGFFVNTVAIRHRINGTTGFADLTQQVGQTVLSALAHGGTPFEQVVEACAPERNLSISPLFQVMFVLQNAPLDDLTLNGCHLEVMDNSASFAKFDLTLFASPVEDGLHLRWEYNRGLFDVATIENLAWRYELFLRAAVSEPTTPVQRLSLLDEAERHLLLQDWQGPKRTERPADVVTRFLARASTTPMAPAIRYGSGEFLTYEALAQEVMGIKALLEHKQVIPGQLVGVCLNRDRYLMPCMLGILAAGCAYLPLPPDLPDTRLHYMLENAGATAVFTGEGQRFEESGVTVINPTETAQVAQDGYQPKTLDWDLAYVIYTSGSTGMPKGVAVSHGALAAYVDWCLQAYGLNADMEVPVFGSLGFDATITSLWPPLAAGACLHLIDEENELNTLADNLFDGHPYGLIKMTPAHLDLLARLAPESPQRTADTRFIVGGEALTVGHLDYWCKQTQPPRIINEYGPTEAAVGCAVYTIDPQEPLQDPIPIGRPISEATLHVIERGGQPAGTGMLGELYIGGPGLAQGYLNQPATTAERFLPNPYAEKPGERLYRSGDLVCRRADGELIFLGRADQQLKLRGYRIEPGEIETALRGIETVNEAVVLVHEGQLVAFVAPVQSDTATLRTHLADKLPEYMVPTRIHALDVLPLTANGKLDRSALTALTPATVAPTAQAPRDHREQVLTEIWRDLLGREDIGIHDNFFELGGDSILIIQMVGKAARAGLAFSTKQVFRTQTIAALAAQVKESVTPRAEQKPITGTLQPTPIQRWFLAKQAPQTHHYNQALLFEADPQLTPELLERALTQIVTHHDALRLRLQGDAGWTFDHGPTETFQLEIFDYRDKSVDREAVYTQLQASHDLNNGPLLRAGWFRFSDAERVLLSAHHLVIDGVSWRILLEDLNLICEALLTEETLQLPPKTTSFQAWAHHLNERFPFTCASTPASAVAGTAGDEEVLRRSLTEAQTNRLLRSLPERFRVNQEQVLVAALAEALAEEQDIPTAVTLERHGRETDWPDEEVANFDLSRTVGWFTLMHSVSFDPSEEEEASYRLLEAKERIRTSEEQAWSRFSQDPQGEAARASVLFNYLGQTDTTAAGLLKPVREPNGTAVAADTPRSHLIELSALITDGRMQLNWVYAPKLFSEARMEALSTRFEARLAAFLQLAEVDGAGGYSPSDFPLVNLDLDTLARLHEHHADLEDLYPCTPMQEAMLFQNRIHPDSGEYVEQVDFQIDGSLSKECFAQAWDHICARHQTLRTSFPFRALPQPFQAVHKHINLPWTFQKLGDAVDPPQSALDFALQERTKPFPLEEQPPFRLALLELAPDTYRFIFTFHHILLDGWSMANLFGEVFSTYEQLLAEQRPVMEAVTPFRSYIAWLADQDQEQAKTCWGSYLSGFDTPTQLPGNPIAHEPSAASPQEWHHELGREASEGLTRCARHLKLTPSTLVQAAWAILLGRYAGVEDVVFGVTVSGRPPELDGVGSMIGLFINSLPVRVKLDTDQSLDTWLPDLHHQQQELIEHAFLPNATMAEASDVPGGHALFETLVVFENYPINDVVTQGPAGLQLGDLAYHSHTHLPMVLRAAMGESLGFDLAYDERRFDTALIQQLMQGLTTILEGFVAQPQLIPGKVSLLNDADRHHVLETLNETWADFPVNQTVVDLFLQTASRQPDEPALIFEDQRLSYREVHQQAFTMAARLRNQGVGPDSAVGIFLERTTDMPIAVLATLAAGGTYVPLDPEYPAERLSFMIEDPDLAAVITQTELAKSLPEMDAHILLVDDTDHEVEPLAEPVPVDYDNLLYIIYTSGSTGRPKGIALSHHALTNLIYWEHTVQPGKASMLLYASLSFDPSYVEIFNSWSQGGEVHLVSEVLRREPLRLLPYIKAQRVQRMILPVVVLQLWAEHYDYSADPLSSVTHIISTGEQLQITDAIKRLFQHLKGAELQNHYGPAETHVVTATTFEEDPSQWPAHAPIGHTIANTTVYVLDKYLQPVPTNAPGELYLGGVQVARGYVGRQALTAERFIPDPFSKEPGTRLYRTGDQARRLFNGDLEFIQRLDHMIKVRGYRVEPKEVEANLQTHPQVSSCVVTVVGEGANKNLAAYAVPVPGAAPQTSDLREHCAAHLPHYMVPTHFIILEEMPLSPNQKVDRKRLPAPDDVETALGADHQPPSTEAEKLMAELWADVLSKKAIGVHDNFFDLGGHSLSATRLLSSVEQTFDLEPDLTDLFTRPTVAGLLDTLANMVGGHEILEEIALTIREIEQMSAEDIDQQLDETDER